ncbi:MAG TPA: MaoC family dehydratase [Burkholderiaceae bacterium]
MRSFASLDALRALTGQEVAVSDWVAVTQERVDAFADATLDHQWIHTDPQRAARETPYGGAIAHGYLTLALLPAMLQSAITLEGGGVLLNYGLNKLRFPSPLPAGSRVRAHFSLAEVTEFDGGAQFEWHAVVEREGQDKPVCVAELLYRRYG